MKRQLKLFKTTVKMKVYKPRTPSIRWWRYPIYPYLHKSGPMWHLTVPKKQHSGRNNSGKITVRGRGGGFKRRIRLVDFYRLDPGEHNVERIEHDPNRSGHIALIKHKETGAFSYILACQGLRAGDTVESFRQGIPQRIIDKMGGHNDPGIFASHTAKKGNCLPLSLIPLGTVIHSIGISKVGPAKFCRAAGTFGRLFEKLTDKNRAVVRLQSGELRYVALDACATIGMVSNPDYQHISLGKAGRARNLG
jgi:ribosomal protein L2